VRWVPSIEDEFRSGNGLILPGLSLDTEVISTRCLLAARIVVTSFSEWKTAMAEPIRTSAPYFGTSASALRFTGLILLLVASRHDARALPTDGTPSNTAQVCASFGNEFDASTDVGAFKDYGAAVAQLLQQEDFKKLDCIADAARSGKTTFAGGAPRLHIFYRGLSNIDGHTTEDDWKDRIAELGRRVSASPESITARVALAKAYVNYAWNARGDGFSDTVSDSGWRLFAQRLAKAKTILREKGVDPSEIDIPSIDRNQGR